MYQLLVASALKCNPIGHFGAILDAGRRFLTSHPLSDLADVNREVGLVIAREWVQQVSIS